MTAAPPVTTAAMNGRSAADFAALASVRTVSPGAAGEPFRRENRPHHVVAKHVAVAKTSPQDAFARGAELFEDPVAPRVDVDGPCLEAIDAEIVEHRVEKQRRGAREQTHAPQRGAQREAPLRGREVAFDRPDLN